MPSYAPSTSTSSPFLTSPPDDCVKLRRRHEKYYIPSGDVVFLVSRALLHVYAFTQTSSQVEDIIFRVHRYFFLRDSPVFRDMFSLPTPPEPGTNVEGASDENPISLPQVTSKEFAHFLWLFYKP